MTRASELPEPFRTQPFHVADAVAGGVSVERLRGRDLARPFHAVRAPREPASVIDRCRAYLPRMRPGDVFSHATAAAVWGMPLTRSSESADLHVTSTPPRRAVRGRGVIGHSERALAAEGRTVEGLPVADPVRVWLQLSTTVPWHELVALGDYVVTGRPFENRLPLASLDELRLGHAGAVGGRGARARALAMPYVRVGAFARTESLSHLLFALAGLPRPDLNEQVLDERGSFMALPDLTWRELRVAYEYEGDHHRRTDQYRRDVSRVERLVDHGWIVVKATADDLFGHPEELVARVARRLASRGWAGRPRELPHLGQWRR